MLYFAVDTLNPSGVRFVSQLMSQTKKKQKLPTKAEALTPVERAVHAAGLKLQKANPGMRPSWDEIADEIGKAKGTVAHAMKTLKRVGLASWNPEVRRSAEFHKVAP